MKLTCCKGKIREAGWEEVNPEKREKNIYDHRLSNNLVRLKGKVFDYAMCNDFEYFVTLTIDRNLCDRYDLSGYKKRLGKFLNNYKVRRAVDVKYLLIPEFHKDGAVHMHGLIAGIPADDLIVNEHGYLDWPPYSQRFGYFSCSPVRDRERCAKYITKYITKELNAMPKGSQILMVSKGLKKPEIVSCGFGFEPGEMDWDFENEYVMMRWMQDGVGD